METELTVVNIKTQLAFVRRRRGLGRRESEEGGVEYVV